ncbi:tryptophan synthase subunit alpha [Gloeobacter morelensis]|uniref:Tryptophan synthase alpha chain n=1 Tax=Gloeobacter morelensis MG652769 TaxID=2781736 RepID=A0ABY3PJA0_9CYAN|nr:tryptophan synthase subunit alpha [Gloeobacter morelensis]UFP93689.1 tryptophan synthase subunit alpha [Gloeobacter morelensis MG652769]
MSSPASPGRIARVFAALHARREVAFIPFITAGDPNLETTAEALLTLDRNGADVLELGVPYSDPLADGPTIQAAATRALARGTTPGAVLDLVARLTPELRAPLIVFIYFNLILAVGIEAFVERLAASGASGLLVPDLPVEEGDALQTAANVHGLDIIWLVAPTSPPERLRRIAERTTGFVYLVSTTGVTGARAQVASSVRTSLAQLRALTTRPVAVGFGISTPEQAHEVASLGADGVIVGSACVQLLATTAPQERLGKLAEFCRQLKEASQTLPAKS